MKRVCRCGAKLGFVTLCFATIGGVPTQTLAAHRPGTGVAHPRRYVSPSGVFALFVDPNDRYGRSSASYRFTKNGKETWSGERPYTLREVVVTDEGISAGLAYREGPKNAKTSRGRLRGGWTSVPPEYLHIVILDSHGQELLNDTTERAGHRVMVPPPPARPYVRHFLVDLANDRLMVHVSAKGPECWVFRLSSGKPLTRFKVKDRMPTKWGLNSILDVRVLQESPLVLLHWYLTGRYGRGAMFALLDQRYECIWHLRVEDDYNDVEWCERGVLEYFHEHPAILSVASPHRFELRLFGADKRVSFTVCGDDDEGYAVREVGRVDFSQEPSTPTADGG